MHRSECQLGGGSRRKMLTDQLGVNLDAGGWEDGISLIMTPQLSLDD